jgi:hypothetical protein
MIAAEDVQARVLKGVDDIHCVIAGFIIEDQQFDILV